MNQQQAGLETWAAAQWNGIHKDSRNSDCVTVQTASRFQYEHHLLRGASVLFGPSVNQQGQLFVCTGQGEGHSHLHSFSADGTPLWQSPKQSGQQGLGSRACPFAPLLDAQQRVFCGDQHQFFAFDTQGNPLWQIDMRALGCNETFAAPVFDAEGNVGGVTLDGKVLFVRRDSGELAKPVLTLPEGCPAPAMPAPPGLWRGGLMDESLIPSLCPAFFGTGYPVTCSPTVNPINGHLYITAAGETPAQTRLFAIDTTTHQSKVVFSSVFGGPCAMTTSISPDGAHVFSGDLSGKLHSFDTRTGKINWTFEDAGPAASPTIDSDGRIYTGTNTQRSVPSTLYCLDPANGKVIWQQNYDALAQTLLSERASLGEVFPDTLPIATINGVPTVTDNHIHVTLVLGYRFVHPQSGAALTQPQQVVVAHLDKNAGALKGYTEIPDTNEGTVVITQDGALYVSHASLMSSLFYCGIAPMLPESHRSSLKPAGGVSYLKLER